MKIHQNGTPNFSIPIQGQNLTPVMINDMMGVTGSLKSTPVSRFDLHPGDRIHMIGSVFNAEREMKEGTFMKFDSGLTYVGTIKSKTTELMAFKVHSFEVIRQFNEEVFLLFLIKDEKLMTIPRDGNSFKLLEPTFKRF